MMVDTSQIQRMTFRYFVIALSGTFVYDVFFLIAASAEYSKEDAGYDGGVEESIRKFSLVMSYISLFFRVRLCF